MNPVLIPHKFTAHENQTWSSLFSRLAFLRDQQMHPIFSKGIELLSINANGIPNLNEVNSKLKKLTGFVGVLVEGHEAPRSFFPMLARREFPIGNFIRDSKDLDYTPAPDIFHDLYGHLPFLADPAYANFSCHFGEVASKFEHDPELLRQFERFYWFALEFGLMKTKNGIRIFGGGIASSFRECAFSLSTEPEVVPFDLELIRQQEFKIDELQRKLFLIESESQLYQSLDAFEKGVK